MAFGVLPAAAVVLGAGAGFLGWQELQHGEVKAAAAESVSAARDTAVAILSYRADTVESDLNAARDRLTAPFLDSYTKLIHDIVIPGARTKHLSSTATVAAAASVSATADRAVVLVFIDQTATNGKDAPTGTASSVRVKLDKVGGRWLVSAFDPI